jgi:hypothetical protein
MAPGVTGRFTHMPLIERWMLGHLHCRAEESATLWSARWRTPNVIGELTL